jgi:hypothetical protein
MRRFVEVWMATCEELGIECAAARKRSLCTFVLSLGVVLCHTLRSVLIPTAKVSSASSDLADIHSGEPNQFSKCSKAVDLVGHFCDALGIPQATTYGMYADFRGGSKDPNAFNALIRASPSTIAECGRWLKILCTRICGSFAPEGQGAYAPWPRPWGERGVTDSLSSLVDPLADSEKRSSRCVRTRCQRTR